MQYFGKYRGTVVNVLDPLALGRLQVAVADVVDARAEDWALPCLPPGSLQALPHVGATVWVEFERGDVGLPIWCGLFWLDPASTPDAMRRPTQGDTLSLRTAAGAGIEIGDSGIIIDNGRGARVVLQGPLVSVNNGALDIQ